MPKPTMVEVAKTYGRSFAEGDACVAEKELEKRNVERMGALVDARGRDDYDAVRQMVHDDVTLTIVAPPEVPFMPGTSP